MPETDIDIDALSSLGPEELLRYAAERFGDRAALGTSLQKTGTVMIDMAHRLGLSLRVFFIDTLLNHDETYELLGEFEKRYGITIERFSPDPDQIESLNKSVGQYAHFLARPMCCQVRKAAPLQKALATLDVWISGLRADQSEHRRKEASKAGWTHVAQDRTILKLNPLLDWTSEDVDRYIDANKVPYNKLYDYVSEYGEKYNVIGCRMCHIPVRDEFDPRLGKFPWEQSKKECGLHDHGSGI
ncbi:MAG: phosphoadenylyl-sulfate reductase [Phycisphaerae bacterium]|jgi:phosphoadenosine phosphosulfate reductase|nr:phosphoadenylyl-sulfate reductase [Phycisphaerae bacterium]